VWQSAELVRTFLTGVRGGIPYAADQIGMMTRLVREADIEVARFLDLGCGSGTLAAALLAEHPAAQAVLVDFSEPMLDAARASFPSPPHQLILADFNDPGWVEPLQPLAPFDVVVSGYAIHHSTHEKKREIYAAVYDLLAPGGIFVNVEHVKPATAWVGHVNDELFVDSIHANHERLGNSMTRERVATEYVYRPDKAANILAPVEDQCAWLRDIGFADVDCYFKVLELAVFGGRKTE
jgi:SAM-dependent methyltransferase